MNAVAEIDSSAMFNKFLNDCDVSFPTRSTQRCLVTVIQCIHISSSINKFSGDLLCEFMSY